MFNPLESVNNPALSVANNNNLVLVDGVIGNVGGVKSLVYNAVPLTKLKLVIDPGKAYAVGKYPEIPTYNLDNNGCRSMFPMLFPGFERTRLTYILNVVPILDIAMWFQDDNIVNGRLVTKDKG